MGAVEPAVSPATNTLQRINREIGRGTDVVAVFPNDAGLLPQSPLLRLGRLMKSGRRFRPGD
jgi:Transposase, Mutator family